MAKINLELITDPDMYIFFKKDTRGGIYLISNRYSKASNQYLKAYDLKPESKHIIYFDANSLYECAMSRFLPTSGFKQLDSKEFDLNKYTSNISKGCFLEVDLEFSKESRELHDDYPLAPDKIELKREMLSEYQLKIVDLYSILIDNVKKVVSMIRNAFASL